MFPDLSITPSPNWNERPSGSSNSPVIDTVVLHYTGMQTGQEALNRLCDNVAEVSAHYFIEEEGKVHQLVHPDQRAWHAGVSSWQSRNNLNDTSIGIELVNPGHEFGYRAFPVLQIESLLGVLKYLKQVYNIPKHRFIGHSDIAPMRKQDPGELFPWKKLASNGFGLWPNVNANDDTVLIVSNEASTESASLKENLSIIGYDVESCNSITHMSKVLEAFQRHWRPSNVHGLLDQGTLLAIEAVVALTREHQNAIE